MTNFGGYNWLHQVWIWKWKRMFRFYFPFWVKIEIKIDTRTSVLFQFLRYEQHLTSYSSRPNSNSHELASAVRSVIWHRDQVMTAGISWARGDRQTETSVYRKSRSVKALQIRLALQGTAPAQPRVPPTSCNLPPFRTTHRRDGAAVGQVRNSTVRCLQYDQNRVTAYSDTSATRRQIAWLSLTDIAYTETIRL